MLAALARFYQWPLAELEALSIEDTRFWLEAADALNEQLKEQANG